VDAILVGVGTVLADDPSLTARVGKPKRHPLPIILDARLDTPPGAKALRHPKGCVVVCGKSALPRRRKSLEAAGAKILEMPSKGDMIRWTPLLKELGRREITSLLIEGGARVFGSAIEAGIVNKLWLFIAPMLIGGDKARGTLGGEGFADLADCPRLKESKIRRSGPDLWIEGYL
jgi:diaminohydroxyphosphoribosylaminopyrimidine deaminase/5-amino-6-(5-phosphoribosylamino)uracil reductase